MNADILIQVIRDVFEKNTMNENPFSLVTNCEINFIETKQFKNKMIACVEYIGNQRFYVIALTEDELSNLPREEELEK